ncbi:OmpA family protein [Leisingera sp. ANG59]|uniref:OmpA family protein n=1 Tax=Leisingera sp. ANG59 TaxID=2675221 RepID=UPI0015718B14|nr:OmpA family protein [Leisingera sp. ANG59]NSY39175.1 OmpA family protein [Leisingera sp. ANG59]
MKPGIFKSSTALAVMISLAAPLPALSQDKGNKRIDLAQMSAAEIGDLVDRCRKRAERRQKKLEAGEEIEQKNGKVAQFCQAYGEGAFDAALPADLQSANVLAGIGVAEAEETAAAEQAAGEQAETVAEAQPDTGSEEQREAEVTVEAAGQQDAQEQPAAAEAPVETDAQAEADAQALAEALAKEEAEAQAAAEEQAAAEQAQAGTAAQAETEVQTEQQAENGTAASVGTSAEEIAADLAQSQGGTGRETDNPELVEQDSQAQADALAEETSEPAAAAAAAADGAVSEGEAEVTEEMVTEDTARSSDEEFETGVNENAQAEAQAPAPQANAANEDDSGLSIRERNALLGLGALAIGTLLNNGGKVVSNSGDRAIVEQDGQYRVLKDDDALLRQPGSNVTTYRFQDGSTRTVVVRENGVEVETIRSAEGRVLRRTKLLPDGRSVVLFDDTQKAERVVVNELPQVQDNRRAFSSADAVSAEDQAAALAAQEAKTVDRRFSLAQIRNIDAVRRLTPVINVDTVNFDTGSAVIRPQEAEELATLGNALRELIDRNPGEVFLIEGHTDAVGAATYNLALSDRRAETVALALTEYFGVAPENMVVQGYGESDLAISTLAAERANRRVAVRRITQLLGNPG